MNLTNEDIVEYQRIWKEVYREDISEGEARISANQLIGLYLLLAKHRLSPVEQVQVKTRGEMLVGVPVRGWCRAHTVLVSAHRFCSLYAEVR